MADEATQPEPQAKEKTETSPGADEWVAYTPRSYHAFHRDGRGRTPHLLGLKRVATPGLGRLPEGVVAGQPYVEELTPRRLAEVLDHLRRAPDPRKAKEDLVIIGAGQPWPARQTGEGTLDVYPPGLGGLVLHETGARLLEGGETNPSQAAPTKPNQRRSGTKASLPPKVRGVSHTYRPLRPGEELDFPHGMSGGPAPAPGGGIPSVEASFTVAARWTTFAPGAAPGEHLAPAAGVHYAAELSTRVPPGEVGARGTVPVLGCDQVFRLRWVTAPGTTATLDLLGMTNVLGRPRCHVARLRAYIVRLLLPADDPLLPDDCGGEVKVAGLRKELVLGPGGCESYADSGAQGFHVLGAGADGEASGNRTLTFENLDGQEPAAVELLLFGCAE